jgi:hypothetical protein
VFRVIKALLASWRRPPRNPGVQFFRGSQMWGLPWFGEALDPDVPADRQGRATEDLDLLREEMPPKRP